MGNQLLRHLLSLEQFSSARNLTKFLISRYGMSLNYAETMAFAADRVFDWEESKYFWGLAIRIPFPVGTWSRGGLQSFFQVSDIQLSINLTDGRKDDNDD